MAGLFALSVNPREYKGNFQEDLFWGTFYHQHLGEAFCGVSTYNNSKINIRTHVGLFRPNFEHNLEGMEGTEGIGYCGLAREPFRTESKLGMMSLCFSGNIINRLELEEQLKAEGQTFDRGDDIEIIAKLLSKGETVIDGIEKMTQEIKGTFVLLILSERGIYAVRSPDGHWPLVIGEKEGALAIACESAGFDNLGFRLVRDLEPGEIILIKEGREKGRIIIPGGKMQICSFLWVYTAFPNTIIHGIPASSVRKELGASLARRDIERGFIPHLVCPVPDSGRFHAIGYLEEFSRQMMLGRIKRMPFYNELLLKYSYAGRSYPRKTKEERSQEAYIKILRSGESADNLKKPFKELAEFFNTNLDNLIVVLCEDSIVRGTQIRQNLVPKLRSIGIREIHVRVSNPELLSHCPWGKTTKKGETLAERLPRIEDRIKELGVDGLEYNTIEDLIKAIGLPPEQLCVDCSLRRE